MGKNVSWLDHAISVLALPVVMIAIVPAALLSITGETIVTPIAEQTVIGLGLVVFGVYLTSTSITLFIQKGKGTLAPWKPTRSLVTTGLYEHVRNPMILGVILILLGETAILNSLTLLAWTIIFFGLNHYYITRFEEPSLKKRFGRKYENYKKTPRWIPKRKK